jgi:hypothetical protein
MNTLVVPDFNRKESRLLSNSSTLSCASPKNSPSSIPSQSQSKLSLPSIVVKSPEGIVTNDNHKSSHTRWRFSRPKSYRKTGTMEVNSSLYNKTVKVPLKDYQELRGYTGSFSNFSVNVNKPKHANIEEAASPKSALLPNLMRDDSYSPIKRNNSFASLVNKRFSPVKSPKNKLSAEKLWDRLEQAIESEAVSVSQQKAYLKNILYYKMK